MKSSQLKSKVLQTIFIDWQDNKLGFTAFKLKILYICVLLIPLSLREVKINIMPSRSCCQSMY